MNLIRTAGYQRAIIEHAANLLSVLPHYALRNCPEATSTLGALEAKGLKHRHPPWERVVELSCIGEKESKAKEAGVTINKPQNPTGEPKP